VALADEMLAIANEVTGRGLSLKYYYTARNGQLVISLENKAAVAKHRALITDMIRRAGGTPASTED
jgi:hypothetical protein